MKSFFRLYLKELKFLAGMGAILLLIHFGLYIERFIYDLNFYLDRYLSYKHVPLNLPGPIWGYIFGGMPFYYSIMLVFSFFMENRSKTSYQLVALPVRRFYIIGSKFLAVLSIGIMIFLVMVIMGIFTLVAKSPFFRMNCLLDLMRLQGGHAYLSGLIYTIHSLFFSNFVISWIPSWIFFMTYYPSLALISQTVSELVHKHKILVWAAVFMAGYLPIPFISRTHDSFMMAFYFQMHFAFSLLFIITALVLYERFKEV